MRERLKEIEFKRWGLVTIVIIVVWSIVIAMMVSSYNKSKESILDSQLKRFEGEVKSTLITYGSFSNFIYDELSQDEEVMSILKSANSASDGEKEVLRDELYSKLYNKYEMMKKHKFRQFHFHLADTESFLRMHTREKYGDKLADVRESVRLVNKDKEPVTGFEEGKIYNGFRYVYPLEYNKEHVGSVEVSISVASIIEVLSQLYSHRDFQFIIDKSVVDENVFQDELGNYQESKKFPGYYFDREVNQVTAIYNTMVEDLSDFTFEDFKSKYKEKLDKKESFSVIQKFNGKDYVVRFLSLENTKDIPIAYLISASESNSYNYFTKEMYHEIALVSLLVILVIIFSFILTYYQSRLRTSSELDYLTKAYNRNKFYEMAKKEAKRSQRYEYDSALMLIDIDYFKNINDSYGHEWGDRVLKKLSSEISENIRDSDIFARWGGEEFVLLLSHISKENALKVAEKLRRLIDESQDHELREITISIGVSTIYSGNYDIDSVIKLADDAMYCAKRNGRNQIYYK